MNSRKLSTVLAIAVILAALSPSTTIAGIEPEFQALEWRQIGPFNGGRGTSVVGRPADPQVFWFGHGSGGLWKTEDAGAYWDDPDFDPDQRAFYYVRVIEIPKPRWTAYHAKFFQVEMGDHVRMVVQDRAYTSPIWYTPGE